MPALEASGYTDSDVIIANLDQFYDHGKCSAAIFDERFHDYDYLCITDSDVFVVPFNQKRCQFFKRIFDLNMRGVGVGYVDYFSKLDSLLQPRYWWDSCFEDMPFDKRFKNWKSIVTQLTNKRVVQHYTWKRKKYPYPNAWIKTYHMNSILKPIDRYNWFKESTQKLRNDEAVLSLRSLYDSDFELWSFFEKLPELVLRSWNELAWIESDDHDQSLESGKLMHIHRSLDKLWYDRIGVTI